MEKYIKSLCDYKLKTNKDNENTGKIELIDLNNITNEHNEGAVSMRNSNGFSTPPAENEGAGVGVRVPHKLYNKISNLVDSIWENPTPKKQELSFLETETEIMKEVLKLHNNFSDFDITFKRPEKVAENAHMEEIGLYE